MTANKRMRVYVTAPLPGKALAELAHRHQVYVERRFSSAHFRRELAKADAAITLLSHSVPVEALRAALRLRVVANYAVGYNNVDYREAQRLGIWVTHTPGVLTEATADLAWALVLAVSRRLVEANSFMKAGKFKGWAPGLFLGTGLQGKTLGIFGMGRIGQAVARRASAFGMKVLYCSRRSISRAAEKRLKARFAPFGRLLGLSDVLTVHAPLTPETRGRFGAGEFSRMKRGAIFINTARGEIMDEGALAKALLSGRLSGAGLDVFEREPDMHPLLRRMPNVVALPHIASATMETRAAMAAMVCEDVRRVLEGRRPAHPIRELRRGFRPRGGVL
jgi:glyoxylate reductase